MNEKIHVERIEKKSSEDNQDLNELKKMMKEIFGVSLFLAMLVAIYPFLLPWSFLFTTLMMFFTLLPSTVWLLLIFIRYNKLKKKTK